MNEADWPHDPDGDAGSEGGRVYGMAVIAKKVTPTDEYFPLDVASFLETHGDDPVRINHETVVSVSDIFRDIDRERFDSVVSFHRAVGNAMRSRGFWQFHPTETISDRSSSDD